MKYNINTIQRQIQINRIPQPILMKLYIYVCVCVCVCVFSWLQSKNTNIL